MANKRDDEFFTQEEKAYVDGLRAQAQAGSLSWSDANKKAETIRAKYGYSGGADGSGYTSTYGGSIYDNDKFSQDELKNAAKMRAEALLGNTTMDSAHNYVEQIRGKYGYSGGADGSQMLATPQYDLASLRNMQAPTYSSEWDSQTTDLMRAALGMNYADWVKGDQYKALANRYGQSGLMAMQNTLGQVSSRTGGLASSYATTASQQQYNDYMSRLEDAARQMYGVERGEAVENAQLAKGMSDSDYSRYIDRLGQFNADRSFELDLVNRIMSDKQYQDETAYNRNQYETEYSDEMSLNKAKTLAAAGDFSGYKALGYSDAEIATMKKAYDAEMAASTSRSGSSGSGAKEQKPTLTYTQAKQLYEDGVYTDKVLEAMTYYTGLDYGKSGSLPTAPQDDRGQISAGAQKLVSGVERLIEGRDSDYDYVQRTIQNYMQQQILKGESQDAIDEALRALGMDVEW